LLMAIRTWGIGYEAAVAKAKQIYSKIGRIPCPLFNGEFVVFNRHGFTHILRRGKLIRPKAQRLIRLRLIEFAETIIKTPDGSVTVEFRDEYEIERVVNRFGKKILEKRKARSWGFVRVVDDSKITIVVGQIDGGQKEFLSIMAEDFELHDGDKTQSPTD